MIIELISILANLGMIINMGKALSIIPKAKSNL